MQTTICETCHNELHIGDHPFCPHGPTHAAIVRDEIPGGQIFENGFDQPTRFDSHSAHRKALDANGMMIKAKWVPGDKHLTNWGASIDAGTLESARILVSRGRKTKNEPEPTWDGTIEKRDAGTFRIRPECD